MVSDGAGSRLLAVLRQCGAKGAVDDEVARWRPRGARRQTTGVVINPLARGAWVASRQLKY